MSANITALVQCDVCKARFVFSEQVINPEMPVRYTHHMPVGWQVAEIGGKWYWACGNECYKKLGTVDKKRNTETVFTSERCWPEVER